MVRRSRRTRRARNEQGLGKALPNKYDRSVRHPFQFVKLWPRVDTCFLLFPEVWKFPFQNGLQSVKVGSAQCLLLGRVAVHIRIKFLPLFCSGVVRLARSSAGSWRCIQSGRLMRLSRYVWRIASRLSGCKSLEKKKAPRHQKILSWVDGGKTVWWSCGADKQSYVVAFIE